LGNYCTAGAGGGLSGVCAFADGSGCEATGDYHVAFGNAAITDPSNVFVYSLGDASWAFGFVAGTDSSACLRISHPVPGAAPSVKTFVIPHPEHEGKMLRHACIETPTRGTNMYEYQFEATEANQTTELVLPSYFKHLNGRPRVYVAAENVFSGCYGKVNEDLTHIIVQTEKIGTFNVLVTGVRKDPGAIKYSSSIYIDEPIAPKDLPPSQTQIIGNLQ